MRHAMVIVASLVLLAAATLWAQTPGSTGRDCDECPEMVVIPAGKFTMGSPSDEAGRYDNEGLQRTVTIARMFALGKYEVTRGQFAAFVRDTGYVSGGGNCFYWNSEEGKWTNDDSGRDWRNPGFSQSDNHPVVCVSWDDAKAYAEWLSRKTKQNYRLPSEAEWEYAVRAGTAWARPWGEDPDLACRYANVGDRTFVRTVPPGEGKKWNDNFFHQCSDGHAYTAPVGSFQANNFRLYDIIGNVWEWTEDCWNESYSGAPGDGSPWRSGDCARRVARGGGWFFLPRFARSANRSWDAPGHRRNYLGFRVARTL